MLSKCANPGCAATFLYLHQGKLFRLDTTCRSCCRHIRAQQRQSLRDASNSSGCAISAPRKLTLGYKQRNRNHGGAPAESAGARSLSLVAM